MDIPTLPGIQAQTLTTARLTTRVLFSGSSDETPVVFIHGNASNATYWEEIMLALPAGYRGIAPDQRGYGDADRAKKIDATRGMGDLSDDVIALLNHLEIDRAHLVGHSMGGSVIWQLLIDAPERVLTVTLACPGSPFGFGGTKNIEGELCYADGAGSGGGIVNKQFTDAIARGDRGDETGSPRFVMNTFYFKPPFKPAREEELLSGLLSEHIGEQEYPGDSVGTANWPFSAPGKWGPANALAPIYVGDVSALYQIDPKPPILWIRGSHDQIVSDNSLFEMSAYSSLIPGYPGVEVFPPQPMVSQTRYVLDRYAEAGGRYREEVIADTGHTPYLENPAEFNRLFHLHLGGN